MNKEQKNVKDINKKHYLIALIKTIIALIVSVPLMVIEMMFMFKDHHLFGHHGSIAYGWIVFVISIFVIFGLGYQFYRDAFFEVFKWKRPGMNLLIILSVTIAFIYSFYAIINNTVNNQILTMGFFETACMIIATMSVGELVNSKIKLKANQDIQNLNDLQVKKYNSYNYETKETTESAVFKAQIGEYALVKKGEVVPLDGVLVSDFAEIDESSLTGEANPVLKEINNEVMSGTINIGNNFVFKITKRYADSTIKKIINGVNQINNSKPKLQQIADRISLWFTPFIFLIAIIAFCLHAFIPEVRELKVNFANLQLHSVASENIYQQAVYVAVSVLVISCPCAFGIAVPLAVLIGAGRGAKNGITFNNSNAFDKIKKINAIAFDKTGTLTNGMLEVEKIVGDHSYLKIVHAMENVSLHPLAKSFVKYAKLNNIDQDSSLKEIKEIPGVGLQGFDKNNNEYLITSIHYAKNKNYDISNLKDLDIDRGLNNQNLYTNVILFYNQKAVLGIVFKDHIREDAKETIQILKHYGIDVYMITGDNKIAATNIANELNINNYYYEVKPEQKADIIRKIQQENKTVMYVGDGINDLLALKQADLSVSVGVENKATNAISDVSLLKPSLLNIFKIIRLTKKTKFFIITSLLWAFGYNLIFIPLALLGIIPAFISVLIMATSDVAVVLNSVLYKLLKIKIVPKKDAKIIKLNKLKDYYI